jgi:hypothetical protein
MILDRIADQKNLIELASSATHTSNEDAAFADISEKVNGAQSMYTALGIARERSLLLLEPEQRAEVARAAKELHRALGVLANASDTELLAYASTSAEKRGSLLAVSRQASVLRGALLTAQQSLLRRLATDVWPEEDSLRLDVLSHVPDKPGAAEPLRRAEAVHRRLLERAMSTDGIGLQSDELERLIGEATQAAVDARPLRDESVPDDVIDFWEKASSEDGVFLDDVTPEVWTWLETHSALASFNVRRSR